MLQQHPEIQKKAIELISKYADVFSADDSIGQTDLVEFDIMLKPGAKPFKARTRALNPTQLQSLWNQIET